MDATSLSSRTTKEFINNLKADYPSFKFKVGSQEHWSPKTNTITFSPKRPCYGVLHELAHALLQHSDYKSDFELLKLESDAWDLAAHIGLKYGVKINEDYIQSCLDTYRDWLHQRSTCPSCGTHVLQKDSSNYHCYNCSASWRVSSGRFVRSYRRVTKNT